MAALAAVMLPAAGCSTACPAIGYVSVLEVHLEGNNSQVHEVQLCTGQGCSAPAPTVTTAPSVAVSEAWIPLPDGGFSPAPGPSDPPPPYPDAPAHGVREDDNTWSFRFILGPNPDRVTVRALAVDGSVLTEQENDVVWTPAKGYAPCPGPVTTPPLTLRIP
jgi:hypothetical protein